VTGSVPEGLELSDNGAKLTVQKGYESKYQVIGSIEADYERATSGAILKNTYWTWDYDEGWRKGYCYWQVPLKIATLGIWSYVVPLHYPCFAGAPGDEQERVAAMYVEMKRGAKLMGGNLVIVTQRGDLFVVSGNERSVSSYTVKGTSVLGFVVKDGVGPDVAGVRRAP
ncbi:MAG: hypothetical protein AAGA56_23095, partial [Myxococcota bacterium]